MALPPRLRDKFLVRFDDLIAQGEAVRTNTRTVVVEDDEYDFGLTNRPATYTKIDEASFHEWQAKVATLLGQVVPAGHPKAEDIRHMAGAASSVLDELLAVLRAVKGNSGDTILNSDRRP